MNIYLIRHGQTMWNELGKLQGQSDIELNDTGIKQAEKVGLELKGCNIDHIFCSDLKRAEKTAEIISKYTNAYITKDERLREMNLGDWEGMRFDEVQQKYDEFLQRWEYNKENLQVPGGESYGQASARAMDLLKEILSEYEYKNIVIVSHGATIASLMCSIDCNDLNKVDDFLINNCEINKIHYEKDEEKFVIDILKTRHSMMK